MKKSKTKTAAKTSPRPNLLEGAVALAEALLAGAQAGLAMRPRGVRGEVVIKVMVGDVEVTRGVAIAACVPLRPAPLKSKRAATASRS